MAKKCERFTIIRLSLITITNKKKGMNLTESQSQETNLGASNVGELEFCLRFPFPNLSDSKISKKDDHAVSAPKAKPKKNPSVRQKANYGSHQEQVTEGRTTILKRESKRQK